MSVFFHVFDFFQCLQEVETDVMDYVCIFFMYLTSLDVYKRYRPVLVNYSAM